MVILNHIPQNSLIYFDPPYYKKGRDLYINFYKDDDHKKIFGIIDKLNSINCVVLYDNIKQIRELYSKYRQIIFDINYYAGNACKGSDFFIYSDKL